MDQIIRIKREETDEEVIVENGDSDDEFVEPVYLNYFNEQFNNYCDRETSVKVKQEIEEDNSIDDKVTNNNVWIKEEIELKLELSDCSIDEEDFVEATSSKVTSTFKHFKWHKCLYCNYRTHQKGHLNRHKNTHKHLKARTFECYMCGTKFTQKHSMKRHINDIHYTAKKPESTTLYECQLCEYKTTRKGLLLSHRDKHKNASEEYVCFICNFKTKYRRNLRVHMETHRNKEDLRIYSCNVCKFETRMGYCLKRHFLSKRHLKRIGKWEEYCPRGMKMKVKEEKDG